MEVAVQLKICEGCGCLWFRPQSLGRVYCHRCDTKLKDFPKATSRKRAAPEREGTLRSVWAVADASGGLQ